MDERYGTSEMDFFDEYFQRMLWQAYEMARKGKRKTEDEHRFELNEAENILQLRDDIISKTYEPSRGIAFITKEPVIREIFAAPFRDRVVHHFLFNVCNGWWDRHLIYDSYSCRAGKGTLFGIQRLHHHMQSCSNNFKIPSYIIKLDIRAFFMSLNREKVLERINWGLDRQFRGNYGRLYNTVKYLWEKVILDNPANGVKIRGKITDWDELPRQKSLFNQPDGVGIVIGNLTSQLASNIYLDQLDRFCTRDLGFKHYGRYVDDFYIIVTEDQYKYALDCIPVIEGFLDTLGLTLHPDKRYIQPIKHGVPFLGAMIYPYCIVPGKRMRKSFETAALEFENGQGDISTVVSYLGMMTKFKSKKIENEIFDRLGWDFVF
ncbi:RNA-directed DNA polymerase [Candidatus Saccharibacteria bacterium]|nr:RNA-directed DNA polymerase [Candidatus Saccharibacteria bacterium]